jgi:hypothetical protein
MVTVEVVENPTSDGWLLHVTVTDGHSRSIHEVTVSRAAYERLADRTIRPSTLVHESFLFLLEHEPKESILRQFDLPVIGRYFPEYETEIRRRLARS